MTDEPRVEIASCPVQGCGGECIAEALMGTVIRVRCLKCGYGLDGFLSVAAAIAAHNALCADVQRGRDAAKIEQTARDLRHENEALLDMIDKAEAERDALRAENARLREALKQIAGFDDVLDYKRGWDAAEIAQAALDAGKSQ